MWGITSEITRPQRGSELIDVLGVDARDLRIAELEREVSELKRMLSMFSTGCSPTLAFSYQRAAAG